MATEPANTKNGNHQVSWDEIIRLLGAIPAKYNYVYGVPKNGMILAGFCVGQTSVTRPEEAEFILDDVIDSGRTRDKWEKLYPDKPFIALFDKQNNFELDWLVFPWEDINDDAEDLVVRQIEFVGENPNREGLYETPSRVAKTWGEIYGGYKQDPETILAKKFTNAKIDEMIILKDIELYSTCEHHLLPFIGKAHIGYIPSKGGLVGVSKLARLVECFARRMQIQERLTWQVADAITKNLQPEGVGVVIEAKHLCMMARGVEKQNSTMVTSAMLGSFRDKPEVRNEFLGRI